MGSFGLECFSHGAASVTFLENYKEVLNVLKKNIENLKQQNYSKIIEKDIFGQNVLEILNDKFEIIFMDPPFKEKKLMNSHDMCQPSSNPAKDNDTLLKESFNNKIRQLK